MAIAVGNILQITDVQQQATNQLLNVYTYEVIEVGSLVDYVDISNSFQLLVQDEVVTLQHTSLVHTNTVITNLSNGVDIFEEAISIAGVQGAEAMPNFLALSFRYIRSTALTRHGAKRIGGIPEIAVSGNTLAGTFTTAVNAVAAAMAADVTVEGAGDNDFIIRPVIVGRYPQGSPNAGQYDLSKINPINGVQFVRVTTQTTRRIGRGA